MKHKIMNFGIQQMNTPEMTRETGGHLSLATFACSRSNYTQTPLPFKHYYWDIAQKCEQEHKISTPYGFSE